ncbi:MAG: biopolymer transporter ExbD [Lentisphaeria bacterium]|nr:biopolymer transporter ExbD [Lentisphaeria bacterium]NQZ70309.1 biopolymer transporter ExbD [Lentisphaeria bacterium]
MKMKRRKRKMPMIPLSSMGDIAFLLIIFFILTSNFMKEKDLKYTRAQSEDIDKLQPSQISVVIDEKGVLFFNGEETQTSALEDQVRTMIAELNNPKVQFKVDKDIPHKNYADVLLKLSAAEAEISLVGEKKK